MKGIKGKAAAIVLGGVLASGTASACQWDTDCNVGSKCVKTTGNTLDPGICVGGLNPGRPRGTRLFDLPLVETPPRINSRGRSMRGEQCSFNTDCDIGRQCLKTSGSIYGVCN